MSAETISRREFLVFGGLLGSIFGWIPFFRPRRAELAGARFRIVRRGHSSRRYLLIHGDEETARQALQRLIESREGVAFEIESRSRTVPIGGGQIDPNRMFSRAGAEANLKKLNPEWTAAQVAAALDLLDRGREKLLHSLLPPHGGLLVALHNNSEGYSVADEQPASDRAFVPRPDHPHAFYLCTDPADYQVLTGSGYNVALQQHGPEDGSLSRFCATRGVRYVNVECSRGDLGTQMDMLNWLDWRL